MSALAAAGLLGLFYIASFIDLSNHLFTGRTTGIMILRYLWWASPQFTYYLVPLAVLMGALVTIGALTKNSELIVMRACGISLYRAAAPLLVLAIIGSAILMGLEEGILAYSNRRADTINNAIRGRLPTTQELNRRWVTANNGTIYQYLYFEPGLNRLNGLSIYEFGKDRVDTRAAELLRIREISGRPRRKRPGDVAGRQRLAARLPAQDAVLGLREPSRSSWRARAISRASGPMRSTCHTGSSATTWLSLEAGGFNVVPYVVAMHRKLAFPFVTLIMALIAVPFRRDDRQARARCTASAPASCSRSCTGRPSVSSARSAPAV